MGGIFLSSNVNRKNSTSNSMSAIIYWLAIKLYVLAVRIASLFNPKAKLFVKGRRKLLSNIKYALINERRPRIWVHCASLGEFEQGRPVIEALRRDYPNFALVVTFFSPSGYEVRKNYDGADYIFYLPVDSPTHARKFIKAVQPRLCLFVKYELWYYYLNLLAKKDIPIVLISAIFRKSQPFFKWYGRLHRRMLNCFSYIFVQDNESVQLLNNIGVEHVSVGGDTRFDRVLKTKEQAMPLPLAEAFCKDHKVIVAGSTWAEDEQKLQQLLGELGDNWKLIVAPHEVNDKHIADVEQLFPNAVKWSNVNVTHVAEHRVLVVDKIGLLSSIYRYADVAWIGGAFRTGLHNTLEAAVYGLPIMHGPEFTKFKEARELVDIKASFPIDNYEQALVLIQKWESDTMSYNRAKEAAQNYVLSNVGATNKILDYLTEKKTLTVS